MARRLYTIPALVRIALASDSFPITTRRTGQHVSKLLENKNILNWKSACLMCSPAEGDGIVRSPFQSRGVSDTVTYHEFITGKFDEYGDATAIIDGQTGHQYTFNQLRDYSRRLGSALVRMGFKQGDVLCIFTPNVPEYPIAFLAVSGIGGSISPATSSFTVGELEYQVKDTGASFLITATSSVHIAKTVQERVPHLKDIIVIGEREEGCHSFAELLHDDGNCYPDGITIAPRDDVIALPYSSGTTGLPKGVVLSHFNLNSNIDQSMHPEGLLGKHGEDVYVVVLPFSHVYGYLLLLSQPLKQGVKLVVLPRFDLELYLDCIQKYKATVLHIVPPIVLLMAKHPRISTYDFSSVKFALTGAAPLGEKLALEFQENTGISVLRQGYGLTETMLNYLTTCDNSDLSSVGYLLPGQECKVVDSRTGEVLGPHEEGEILLRGPHVMKGYLGNEEATKQSIDEDGWFYTGDLGRYNEDNMFYITGRLKEMIKYKAYQVAPAELESILLTHPAVNDCAVIGIPDEEAGEIPRAYVVKKPDASMTSVDIVEFVNAKVASHKKLRGGVEFIDAIPKSPSGKILRRLLTSST